MALMPGFEVLKRHLYDFKIMWKTLNRIKSMENVFVMLLINPIIVEISASVYF